jgi:hypothetical protein
MILVSIETLGFINVIKLPLGVFKQYLKLYYANDLETLSSLPCAFLQVLRTAVGHRLARVQGFLFKAAFLRRVPTFTRLIIENLMLCFLQSTLYQTSKYLTGSLSLRFKKILTDIAHTDYFEVHLLQFCFCLNFILSSFLQFLIASFPHNDTMKSIVKLNSKKSYFLSLYLPVH